MKKTILLLVAASVYFLVNGKLTFAFSEPSQNRCITLDSGKTYCEPIAGYGAELAIFGFADAKRVAAEVAPFGLVPVTTYDGRAIIGIDTANYTFDGEGSYNEFILMYAVQTIDHNDQYQSTEDFLLSSLNITNDPQHPHFGYYMKKLILDGDPEVVDLAIQLGKAAYGFPKEQGHVDLSLYGSDHHKKVHAAALDNSWSFDFDMVTLLGDIIEKVVSSELYEVGTGLGKPVWTVAKKEADVSRPMETHLLGDSIEFHGTGPVADDFNALGFEADRWVYSPNFNLEIRSAGEYWSQSPQISKSQKPPR